MTQEEMLFIYSEVGYLAKLSVLRIYNVEKMFQIKLKFLMKSILSCVQFFLHSD
jgi:hypothetical protein